MLSLEFLVAQRSTVFMPGACFQALKPVRMGFLPLAGMTAKPARLSMTACAPKMALPVGGLTALAAGAAVPGSGLCVAGMMFVLMSRLRVPHPQARLRPHATRPPNQRACLRTAENEKAARSVERRLASMPARNGYCGMRSALAHTHHAIIPTKYPKNRDSGDTQS